MIIVFDKNEPFGLLKCIHNKLMEYYHAQEDEI